MKQIIIIAGIARSGLSVTMQMLYFGGFPCVGDPPAFEKYGIGCTDYNVCEGKAVKVVDTHLHLPPSNRHYKVIYLHRNLKEQAKSCNKFINAITGLPPVKISKLVKSYRRDHKKINNWAKKYRTLNLDFEEILSNPLRVSDKISGFVNSDLNTMKMADCVIKRTVKCYPGLLELKLINETNNLSAV